MQEPEVRDGCDGHMLLSLWSPNFLNTQRSRRCSQFDIVPPSCQRKLPGHLRWIQKEECNPHASSSPSYDQHRSNLSRDLLTQLGRDKALLSPIVHWVGVNPGQFGIYHCTF